MRPDTPLKELDDLCKEEDALEQSVALNRIVMTMLESKRREDFWLRIILIISLLVNIVTACIFIGYESQFTPVTTTTTETTTVEQDTGEGSGNNVYQSGENASYSQGKSEEVKPDGETDSDNDKGNDNYNADAELSPGSSSDSSEVIPGG